MKAWLMQAVLREKETGIILSRQRPRTAPPETARMWKKNAPNEWEVLDTNYDVPDDLRFRGASPSAEWKQEDLEEVFYGKKKQEAGKK